MKDDTTQLNREVKEFGNGAHVTIPREWVGEEVIIKPADNELSKTLKPPITTSKIHSFLEGASTDDFTRNIRSSDHYPREGRYQYDPDLRFSIDVELVYENDSFHIHEFECGRVIHDVEMPTEEELRSHVDWWDQSDAKPEIITGIDPAVSDIFDHYQITYGDLYHYTVCWNDSEIASCNFKNRSAANGRFYLPIWQQYESLQDYQNSLAYQIATTLSKAPETDYLKYLTVLTQRGINWGEREMRDGVKHDVSREQILEECIFPPM